MATLNATEAENEWEFDWDDADQGNMLGAYFYGYAAGMPLGGAESFVGHSVTLGDITAYGLQAGVEEDDVCGPKQKEACHVEHLKLARGPTCIFTNLK